MGNKVNNIFKEARNVHLTDKEKKASRQVLTSFITQNPALGLAKNNESVRESSASRQLSRRPNMLISLFLSLKQHPMIATIIIALVLASGGGVSYAAEGSLPGDPLYGVKVNVNEEVRSALAVSAESQALWDARRAERRLEEAEKLAIKGRLDAENEARLEQEFQAHTEDSKKQTDRLEAKEDHKTRAEVHAYIEARLRAHQHILARIQEVKKSNQLAGRLRAAIQSEITVQAQAREQAEVHLDSETRANIEADIERKLDRAEDKVSDIETRVQSDTELNAGINLRIDAARQSATQGKAQAEAEQHTEALIHLQNTEAIIEEIDTMIRLMDELGLTAGGVQQSDQNQHQETDTDQAEHPVSNKGETDSTSNSQNQAELEQDRDTQSDQGTTQQNHTDQSDNNIEVDVRLESDTQIDADSGLRLEGESRTNIDVGL